MGKLGQKRTKKSPEEKTSELIKKNAEDAKIVDENKDETPEETKEEEPSTDYSSDDDFTTNPDQLDEEFKFEKAPSPESNPLNIPLANETKAEGKTMEKLGFDTGKKEAPKEDIFGGSEHKENSGGAKKITMEDAFGGGDEDTPIDDVPPPNPEEKDLFDEGGGGEAGDMGSELPKGFVEWSAKKQADFIVNTEAALFEGFAKNKSKINLIDLKQRLNKYNIPAEAKANIVLQVSDFNDQVEEHLKIENDMLKNLKAGWEAVLSQHSNISKHLTPEATLAITHGLVIWKLWAATKELKDYGKQMLIEIKDFLRPFEMQQQQAEAKKEPPAADTTKKAA